MSFFHYADVILYLTPIFSKLIYSVFFFACLSIHSFMDTKTAKNLIPLLWDITFIFMIILVEFILFTLPFFTPKTLLNFMNDDFQFKFSLFFHVTLY